MPVILVLEDDSTTRNGLVDTLRSLYAAARVASARSDAAPGIVTVERADVVLASMQAVERLYRNGAPEGVAVVGEFASDVIDAARAAGMDAGRLGACRDMGTLMMLLDCWLEPGDLVLVKGSRGMRMEQVVEGLRQLAEKKGSRAEARLAA